MLMTAAEYRESLRALSPRVFLEGERIASVADEPRLAPGVEAVGVAYDLAHVAALRPMTTAVTGRTGRRVNRMLHVDESADDLLAKLEAIRLLCKIAGCGQRYLNHDVYAALQQATSRADAEDGGDRLARFLAFLDDAQARDLTYGVAMTDGKGDRSLRPEAQANRDAYLHIAERRAEGIVLRGAKAIVTGGAYMHGLIVAPCRRHGPEAAACAVACATPLDAEGLTIVTRRAGRPGEGAALFSARYGQATAVAMFEDVLVPWDRVFLAGETEAAAHLTTAYATHHRQSCIAARAGFGDLLIGAGAHMLEANGLDAEAHPHIREQMVELIKIVEGFYACGVAASVYCAKDPSGVAMPDAVFANIGKLLLATQIYDMHRIAHYVSGGLIVALPGPDEDHNPETAAALSAVLEARADLPAARRRDVARFIEDLTVSDQAGWYSVMSLHGGGSPEAMKREIWRNYPVGEKKELVDALLDRGVLDVGQRVGRQPGRCCVAGCREPEAELSLPGTGASAAWAERPR
ncbi:MAG: 4-hydroxyphenylacetate 3-hydroxylase N-terminal domain-containing protein [Pseudomonadota bacterium]